MASPVYLPALASVESALPNDVVCQDLATVSMLILQLVMKCN